MLRKEWLNGVGTLTPSARARNVIRKAIELGIFPPGRSGMIHEVALFLKAFIWHLEGRRRTVLSWREDEAFPVLEKKKRR